MLDEIINQSPKELIRSKYRMLLKYSLILVIPLLMIFINDFDILGTVLGLFVVTVLIVFVYIEYVIKEIPEDYDEDQVKEVLRYKIPMWITIFAIFGIVSTILYYIETIPSSLPELTIFLVCEFVIIKYIVGLLSKIKKWEKSKTQSVDELRHLY